MVHVNLSYDCKRILELTAPDQQANLIGGAGILEDFGADRPRLASPFLVERASFVYPSNEFCWHCYEHISRNMQASAFFNETYEHGDTFTEFGEQFTAL